MKYGYPTHWDWPFVLTNGYCTGLMFVNGYALLEKPCTDPYTRFSEHTEAGGEGFHLAENP